MSQGCQKKCLDSDPGVSKSFQEVVLINGLDVVDYYLVLENHQSERQGTHRRRDEVSRDRKIVSEAYTLILSAFYMYYAERADHYLFP